MNKTERIGIINTFVGGTLWGTNGVDGRNFYQCHLVYDHFYRKREPIAKDFFKNLQLAFFIFQLLNFILIYHLMIL